jgi:hypothetical protein
MTMKTAKASGAVLIAVLVAGVLPLPAQQGQFDLLIRGGDLMDPRNSINSVMDVAIAGG